MRNDTRESASKMRIISFLTVVFGVVILFICVDRELAAQTVWDSDIGKEFESNATTAWAEFRASSASKRTQHIRRVTESTSPRVAQAEVEEFLYANGGLRLMKEQYVRGGVEGSSMAALNTKYGFHIVNKEGSSWEVKDVEILEEALASFDPEHLLIRLGINNKPSELAYQRFPHDERLRIIGQPLERFYENIKPHITSLDEIKDPKFGRLVTLKYKMEREFRGKPKEYEGEISFLPDNSWLMASYEYVSRPGGGGAGAAGEHSESFSSEYDSSMGNKLLRAKRTERGRTGSLTTRTYSFRELSSEEIAECKKQCYLSGFGLPEPPGISWGWPRWAYFLVSLGVIALAFGFFTFVRHRKTS